MTKPIEEPIAVLDGDFMRLALRESAGVEVSTWRGDEILDVPFEELGCDSLAVLEMVTRVQNKTGVVITEDDVPDLTTPRTLLEYVEQRRAAA
jgi:act minimal PKS acyl carrier protein